MSEYNAEISQPEERETIVLNHEPYNGWEFVIAQREETLSLDRLVKTVEVLYEQQRRDIPVDDHRLNHIWERAGEIADERGYCDVFDTIMEELGTGYAREVEFCLTIEVTKTYDFHVTAPRTSETVDLHELVGDVYTIEDIESGGEMTDSDISITSWERN